MDAAVHRISLCIRAADLTEAMQAGFISRAEHRI